MITASSPALFSPADLERAVAAVRPYSMVPEPSLRELAWQVAAVLAEGVPGDFVECGVWRGGASFLMAALLRQAGVHDRAVWMFDSFEGLPAPEAVDGPSAARYAVDRTSPRYRDNCRATLEDVRASADALGLTEHLVFVKGWFSETLSRLGDRPREVAILRIDADWHASVRACLDHLYPRLAPGGLVVLDDYYAYEGCAVAVHEFLAEHRLPHRLESFSAPGDAWDGYQAAAFRKGPSTWRLMKRRYAALLDIAAAVPAGAPVVVLDDQQLGLPGRPFPERDGVYWGPPADSASAIRELERVRREGVAFAVVAWPAFWWLDHYAEFGRYLSESFRCVGQTDRTLIVDLRA